MWIAELRYPGTWLDGLSDEVSHQVQALLYVAESALTDAALSLSLFEDSRTLRSQGRPDEWQRRSDLRRQLEEQYLAALGPLRPEEYWHAMEQAREQAELAARRLVWQKGELPTSYEYRLPFLHARGFLFALDGLANCIRVLAVTRSVPTAIADVRKSWLDAFPQLRHVRDTAHHAEDRARGLDKSGNPLDLKAVDTPAVMAPGGALILDMLTNDRYGATLGDGTYGEVEVSGHSLGAATDHVQRLMDAFDWRGPVRTVPT